MQLRKERERIADFGRRLIASGLTTGSGGNLSILDPDRKLVAVTPSGVGYQDIGPADVVVVDLHGEVVEGRLRPSSELAFHLALYGRFAGIRGVVHTHSVYATTLACLGWELPAVHYLVGFAGKKVPLAPYATFGSRELAEHLVRTMEGYRAVLLANHGLVSMGTSLEKAFETAEEIEFVARVYLQSRMVGSPVILPDAEMERVLEKFRDYGQPARQAEK
jgi:L-fuculose-phosphate aldolase